MCISPAPSPDPLCIQALHFSFAFLSRHSTFLLLPFVFALAVSTVTHHAFVLFLLATRLGSDKIRPLLLRARAFFESSAPAG